MDLPTSVEECIASGIAKKIEGVEQTCADLDCQSTTDTAWLQNSTVIVMQEGRMFTRPITMWFPLCTEHSPLQEMPDEPEGEPEDTPLVDPDKQDAVLDRDGVER